MTAVAYIILAFAAAQCLVALSNLIFKEKLPHGKDETGERVSLLIPARNEARNLPGLLHNLVRQPHQNLEIIVFDDESTDNTPSIVESFSREYPFVSLIRSDGLPQGWVGKNYGCHSLARQASGDWLLFLDADVQIRDTLIADTLAFVKRHQTGLLSIFPKQEMDTWGEKATVPLMHWILLSLLPLRLVRTSRRSSLSAANGQYMMFRASAYREMLPHERMKGERVEDIEIARWYKKQGMKVACLAGEDAVSCRMYTGFQEAIPGLARSVVNFFGNSYVSAILYWLATTFGWIIVALTLSPLMLLLWISFTLVTRIVVSLISRQSIVNNLTYLIPQQLVLGGLIALSMYHHLNKSFQWKGRNI